jgi:hypothetical protein
MLSERDGAEMIVAEQKPLEEIRRLIAPYERVLVLGCGTCVTVCFAGGEKEVGVLASSLRMAEQIDGRDVKVAELTIHRQCEPEFIGEVREKLGDAQAVLSLGCGVGVQAIASALPRVRVLPGLNTKFMGETAASAPSLAVPRACSTALVAALRAVAARYRKMSSAPGSSFTIACLSLGGST